MMVNDDSYYIHIMMICVVHDISADIWYRYNINSNNQNMDMVVSINGVAGGFIMGNPMKMDDLGVPPLMKLYIAMENDISMFSKGHFL